MTQQQKNAEGSCCVCRCSSLSGLVPKSACSTHRNSGNLSRTTAALRVGYVSPNDYNGSVPWYAVFPMPATRVFRGNRFSSGKEPKPMRLQEYVYVIIPSILDACLTPFTMCRRISRSHLGGRSIWDFIFLFSTSPSLVLVSTLLALGSSQEAVGVRVACFRHVLRRANSFFSRP